MKKNMIKDTLGTWLLLVVLITWGCTPVPPNSNVNQNANAAANANSADVAAIFSDNGTCEYANLDTRRKEVYDDIEDKIKKSSLRDQYPAAFKFNVLKAPGNNANSLYLYIGGKISGPDEFAVLEKIIKNFVKRKCTSRVIFVPVAGVPLDTAGVSNDPGFEWTACPYPTVPCPGGECELPGNCPN
ncbi:MAG: hypothetical protein ABIV48_02880 [Pyrinomonadaceae bacterium]